MGKDVLKVLKSQLDNLCVETPEDQAHFDAVEDATARIAELLAADIALDELRKMPAQSEPVSNFQTSIKAAWLRRAAALAACTGEK